MGGSLFLGIARLDKTLTSFRILPSGFWLAPKSQICSLFTSFTEQFSDAYGVRCIGSIMTSRKRSVATLASLLLELTS